jgi:oligosaccharide repeat unit polymerase
MPSAQFYMPLKRTRRARRFSTLSAVAAFALLLVGAAGVVDGHTGEPLAAAAALALLGLLGRVRFRDWLYPPTLQALLWSVLCVYFWLAQYDYYIVGQRVWWIIVLGGASFSLGCGLATIKHVPVLIRNELARDSLPSGTGRTLVLAVTICVLPAFLYAALGALREPGSYASLIADVRAANQVNPGFWGRLYIGFWWALSNLGIALLYAFSDKKRRRGRLLTLLAVLLALGYAIPMGGRNQILFVMLVISAVPLLLRVTQPWRVAAIGVASLSFIFISYAYLAGHMGLNIYSASLQDLESLYSLTSVYLVGPIAAFDTVTHEPSGGFGIHTFRIVYLWLSYLGYSVEVKPIVQNFVQISPSRWTNIYTVYQSYYHDFGIIGVAVSQLLIGAWHGLLYRRATIQQPRAVWVLLYAIFLYPLFMQSACDMYLPALSNWLNFAVIFAIAFVVFRSRRRRVASPVAVPSRADAVSPASSGD